MLQCQVLYIAVSGCCAQYLKISTVIPLYEKEKDITQVTIDQSHY